MDKTFIDTDLKTLNSECIINVLVLLAQKVCEETTDFHFIKEFKSEEDRLILKKVCK